MCAIAHKLTIEVCQALEVLLGSQLSRYLSLPRMAGLAVVWKSGAHEQVTTQTANLDQPRSGSQFIWKFNFCSKWQSNRWSAHTKRIRKWTPSHLWAGFFSCFAQSTYSSSDGAWIDVRTLWNPCWFPGWSRASWTFHFYTFQRICRVIDAIFCRSNADPVRDYCSQPCKETSTKT